MAGWKHLLHPFCCKNGKSLSSCIPANLNWIKIPVTATITLPKILISFKSFYFAVQNVFIFSFLKLKKPGAPRAIDFCDENSNILYKTSQTLRNYITKYRFY